MQTRAITVEDVLLHILPSAAGGIVRYCRISENVYCGEGERILFSKASGLPLACCALIQLEELDADAPTVISRNY